MPAGNGYNIGQDNAVVIIDSVAGRIDFPIVTSFDVKEISKSVSVQPMQGPELFDELPQGWEGSFEIDRASTAADAFFVNRATRYFATNTLSTAKMYQYVTEVGGSQSVWQCSGATFKLTDAGKYAGPEVVKMKISWKCSTRIRIS